MSDTSENSTKKLKKLPKFSSKEEERKFFNEHFFKDLSEYMGGEVAEQGYAFFKCDTEKKRFPFINPPTRGAQLYSENDKRIEDDNLTELVGVRIGKRDLGELKAIAKEEDRALGSLLRLWILQKKREYIFERRFVPSEEQE